MHYPDIAIPDDRVPRAAAPGLQHVLDTYASETNKVAAVWRGFTDADLGLPAASALEHGRRHPEAPAAVGAALLRRVPRIAGAARRGRPARAAWRRRRRSRRLCELAVPRLSYLAAQPEPWWVVRVPFFDVERERIWIVWRRILHTAHHRTQLSVYLRLLDRRVPPTYGPTADATWDGADPTTTVDAAARR